MQNEPTANYRHTGSLYYYYTKDEASHTQTRTNKNPGEKETKEKELPWLCWFAGVARVSSARALPRTCPLSIDPEHTITNAHRPRPLHRPSIDPEHTTLLTACLLSLNTLFNQLLFSNQLSSFQPTTRLSNQLLFNQLFVLQTTSSRNRFPLFLQPTQLFPFQPTLVQLSTHNNPLLAHEHSFIIPRLRPLLRVSPPSPGLPRSFSTQNSFPSLFFWRE